MLPSIRPPKTKAQFLPRPFQFSVNKIFRMGADDLSFKMQVLAGLQLEKQLQKTPVLFNIYAVYCAIKLLVFK